MKQETKELIDWMKKQFSIAGTVVTDVSQPYWQENRKKALDFLNSLPEIEAKLCRGGYIQDKYGTPCCDGDTIKIKFKNTSYNQEFIYRYGEDIDAKLVYDNDRKGFVIDFGEGDWTDWTCSDLGVEWFEKIEG